MKKNILNIKLLERPSILNYNGEHKTNGGWSNNRAKGFKIASYFLSESLSYKPSLISSNEIINISLDPIDSFATNNILIRWRGN
jgi:hypothetical protein